MEKFKELKKRFTSRKLSNKISQLLESLNNCDADIKSLAISFSVTFFIEHDS